MDTCSGTHGYLLRYSWILALVLMDTAPILINSCSGTHGYLLRDSLILLLFSLILAAIFLWIYVWFLCQICVNKSQTYIVETFWSYLMYYRRKKDWRQVRKPLKNAVFDCLLGARGLKYKFFGDKAFIFSYIGRTFGLRSKKYFQG